MEAILELSLQLIELVVVSTAKCIEGTAKLVGTLIFDEPKAPPRRHPRPTPVVIIQDKTRSVVGHVTRNSRGGGTFTGPCFSCNGSGVSPATHASCPRCRGTGVYKKTWGPDRPGRKHRPSTPQP